MTAKRFVLIDIGFVYDNDELIGMKKIVELLNELHEENQSLKFQLDECRNNKLFSRRQLEKEKEQLKQEKQLLYENIDLLKRFIENQGFKVKLDEKLFRVI